MHFFLQRCFVFLFLFSTALLAGDLGSDLKIEEFSPGTGIKIRYTYMTPKQKSFQYDLIFVPGKGGFIEEYQHVCKKLADQGHNVWMMEWRGQGGSTRIPDRVHVNSFDDYIDDLHVFVSSIVESPKESAVKEKFGFLALSMGGHIALRYAADHPEKIAYISTISPMVRIKTPIPYCISRFIAFVVCYLGYSKHFALFQGPFSLSKASDGIKNICQAPDADIERHNKIMTTCPKYVGGGATWGWLSAGFSSTEKLLTSNITTPTLIFETPRDHLIDISSYNDLRRRLTDHHTIRLDAPHDMFYGGEQLESLILWKLNQFARNYEEETKKAR